MSVEVKDISPVVISRLPRYYRYLGSLKDADVERISSKDLSDLMKVTASQIRQDFNLFGGFGQQGYGYNVSKLYEEIGKILGIDKIHDVIIIGAGHIGQALANYSNFENRGFKIVGIFDNDPNLIGTTIRDCKVLDASTVPDFLKDNNIDIAIITVPKNQAVAVADMLVHNNIKAIMNFAHVDLLVPDEVIVENVHLSDTLLKLSYRLRESIENV